MVVVVAESTKNSAWAVEGRKLALPEYFRVRFWCSGKAGRVTSAMPAWTSTVAIVSEFSRMVMDPESGTPPGELTVMRAVLGPMWASEREVKPRVISSEREADSLGPKLESPE